MTEDPIVLEVPHPAAANPAPARLFSVEDLKTPFVPEAVGTVENCEEFSRELPRDRGKDFVDEFLYIKAPGTGFYIPRKFEQFIPMIQAASRHHHENNQHTPFDYCTLCVIQASRLVAGDGLHLDINNFMALMQNRLVNNHSYIAYDKAPTRFYVQPFAVDLSAIDRDDIEGGIREMEAQFRLQAAPESILQFPAFHIIHFDSTDVHSGFAIPNMGQRTVCTVAFAPKIDGVSPERIKNPHLLEAMAAVPAPPAWAGS